MPVKATEDDVLRWLSLHFRAQSWAAVPQVTVAMVNLDGGKRSWTSPTVRVLHMVPEDVAVKITHERDRRIDMLLARSARNPAYGPIETMAVEVKVSRADFLSDVKDPSKQAPWRAATTRHTYAVPAGLVQAHEVPEGSGLLWLAPNRYASSNIGMPEVTWARKAPYRKGHAPQLPARVIVAMLHRASDFEADVRGWNMKHTATEGPEELRAELRAVKRQLSQAETRAGRHADAAEAWKKAYGLAAPDGIPCGICGRPVKPKFPKRDWFREWAHIDPADDAPCAAADEAQRIAEAKEDYEKALADPDGFERTLRAVHRWGFREDVEAEPWRAFFSEHGALKPYPTDTPTGEAS
jgi:hypothetical protein